MKRVTVTLSLALATLSGCSLLFDGSGYRGGTSGGGDGGGADAGADAGRDAGGALCTAARRMECGDTGALCDPATGACTATCTAAICEALTPGSRCHPDGLAECVQCRTSADCGASRACSATYTCIDCDSDGDGWYADLPGCETMGVGLPRDCNDGAANIYPGALPFCNNAVDESCGGGTVAGGLADELGLYDAVDVALPPATDRASRLRVFLRTAAGSVLVFFIAGDAERRPHTAEVDLPGRSATPPVQLATSLMRTDSGRAYADAIRLPSGDVLAAMMSVSGSRVVVNAGTVSVGTGAWTAFPQVLHDVAPPDRLGFTPVGSIALVARMDTYFLAIAATTTMMPATSLWALGANNSHIEQVGIGGVAARPDVLSAGSAAGYPGMAPGSYRFWGGRTGAGMDMTEPANVMPVGGDPMLLASGAVVAARGAGDDNRLAFLVPSPDRLYAFTIGCTTTAPLSSCNSFAAGPDSPNDYAYDFGTNPVLSAALLSSSAVLIASSHRRSDGATEIGLSSLETTPLGTSLLQFPVGIAVRGIPVGVAIDARLIPDAVTPSDRDAEMQFAIAHVEEEGASRRLRVIGGRACVGYGSF